MTIDELIARFPEIPASLRGEPMLKRYAECLGEFLESARQPSPCATSHDAANHYYLKLIGPMAIHGYGLSSLEKVLGQMQGLLDQYQADPAGFGRALLPRDTASEEVRGPGCD